MRIFALHLADDTDLCYNNARQNLSANVNGEVSTEEAYNEKLAEYNSKTGSLQAQNIRSMIFPCWNDLI